MKLEAPKNPNYAATVVALKDFVLLPNCDNVKAALIFNNSVIVSKTSTAGELGLYFPPETALSHQFLSNNNLYRKPEFGNVDPEQTGFFEQHGRVKAVKFRGHKSEGFFIPLDALHYTDPAKVPCLSAGDTFDKLGEYEICRKYLPKMNPVSTAQHNKKKEPKLEDSIVDGQFRFHFDTENLRRNVHKILPTDIISISDKWHGTSVVIANLLVKRVLPWHERLLQRLGVNIETTHYGPAYSSRRVIKAVNGVQKDNNHFYTADVWGQVAQDAQGKIPAGFTIYGEIVGFTQDGQAIQSGYSYGCVDKQHKLVVYRVTSTNAYGMTIELSWPQVTEFCALHAFEMVPALYYGEAQDWLSVLDETEAAWQERFLKQLEGYYVNDGDCKYNPKGTPAEGIVVRIDRLNQAESYKLKNFRFLEAESKFIDKGKVDLETAQSATDEVAA